MAPLYAIRTPSELGHVCVVDITVTVQWLKRVRLHYYSLFLFFFKLKEIVVWLV